MDYLGSKVKLLNWIFGILYKYIDFENRQSLTFLDACAGTGSVSSFVSNQGFTKIVSNDMMEYSRCISSALLNMNFSLIEEAVYHLNKLAIIEPKKGFFYNEYSEQSGRLYFTDNNAMLIDSCRDYIENTQLNPVVKDYLLYCLLEAVSAVSNTSGTYGAYLKQFKKRALLPLKIKPLPFSYCSHALVYHEDILVLLKSKKKFKENILYIDPPYNERQYGANYHIYETIAKYDFPKVKGKTGLRDWISESKSKFCSREYCLDFLCSILTLTEADIVLLSYSSDGLLDKEDILSMVKNKTNFKASLYQNEYKRYKADGSRDNRTDALYEFLFVFYRSQGPLSNCNLNYEVHK